MNQTININSPEASTNILLVGRETSSACGWAFIFDNMKEIILNRKKGNCNLTVLVDDENYEFLNQFSWYPQKDARAYTYYAKTNIRKENGKPTTLRMHTLIMGKKQGLEIDHKDGNGLNNQKSNLKHCTHSENMLNRRSSNIEYFGICKRIRTRGEKVYIYWTAQYSNNGKQIHIGCFKSQEQAKEAYNNRLKSV